MMFVVLGEQPQFRRDVSVELMRSCSGCEHWCRQRALLTRSSVTGRLLSAIFGRNRVSSRSLREQEARDGSGGRGQHPQSSARIAVRRLDAHSEHLLSEPAINRG
jgi:hypothetical protein